MDKRRKWLVLDDSKNRIDLFKQYFGHEDLSCIQNAKDACALLAKTEFDVICLDHDLGEGSKNGLDVVRYMTQNNLQLNHQCIILVHSMNPVGAVSMVDELSRHGYTAVAINFAKLFPGPGE